MWEKVEYFDLISWKNKPVITLDWLRTNSVLRVGYSSLIHANRSLFPVDLLSLFFFTFDAILWISLITMPCQSLLNNVVTGVCGQL